MKKYMVCFFIIFSGCGNSVSVNDSDKMPDHDIYANDSNEEDIYVSDKDTDIDNDTKEKQYDIVELSQWEKIAYPSAVPFYGNTSYAELNEHYYKVLLDDVFRSSDGIYWEQITDNAPFLSRTGHTVSKFKDRLIIAGGSSYSKTSDLWYSEDGDFWQPACLYCPFGSRLRPGAVEFKDRFWIIGGKKNNYDVTRGIWSSKDLKNWELIVEDDPFGSIYESILIIHKDELWVITVDHASTKNSLWRSSDGESWECLMESMPFAVRQRMSFFSWKEKLWIAGGFHLDEDSRVISLSDIWSSDDGVSWEKEGDFEEFGSKYSITVIPEKDELLFINGSGENYTGSGEVISSEDGKNWNLRWRSTVFTGRFGHTVDYFKGEFLVIGGRQSSTENSTAAEEIYSSRNGIDWKLEADHNLSGSKIFHKTVVFKDKLWVIGGRYPSSEIGKGDVWSTADGLNWDLVLDRAPFDGSDVRAAYVYNDEMVIVAKQLDSYFVCFWYSKDGKTWRKGGMVDFMTCSNTPMVVHEDAVYMVGGCNDKYNGNLVYKMTESDQWKKVETDTIFSPRSRHGLLSMGGYLWVIGGHDGDCQNDVWYSRDGVKWLQTDKSPFEPRSYAELAAHDSKIWMFGGYESNNQRSFADVWVTEIKSVSTVEQEQIESPVQVFDEIEWNSVEGDIVAGRYDHDFLKTDNGFYAIGGEQLNDMIDIANSVVYSPDGKTWSSLASNHLILDKRGIRYVFFKDEFWGIAGEHQVNASRRDLVSEIIHSEDGKVWLVAEKEPELTPRHHHQAIVFKDKIWVVGGFDFDGNGMNDVWNSEDGITWKKVVTHAPFRGRGKHKLHVFKDRIFMIGGQSYKYDDGCSEVWSTEDGINWQMESYLGFPQRELPASNVAAGALWVFGGTGNEGDLNDLYYSLDGRTWIKADMPYSIKGRKGAQILGDGDRLWLSGGLQISREKENHKDVWYIDLKKKEP